MEEERKSFTELELTEAPPPTGEGQAPPGPELNRAIAELFAGIGSAFAGPKPRTAEEFQQKYVETVTPILDFLQFQEALGGLGTLPPAARLGIGILVLIGFFIAYHPAISSRLLKRKEQKEAAPTRPEGGLAPQPPPEAPVTVTETRVSRPAAPPPQSVIARSIEELKSLETPVIEEEKAAEDAGDEAL